MNDDAIAERLGTEGILADRLQHAAEGRVDDAQLRPVRAREQTRVQLVVREEQRVRARVVRVEVDDVAPGEVARE